jgi:hypothetical protein
MEHPCFHKKDSDPPACGVHNVPLERHHSSEPLATSGIGSSFDFFVCPVSGIVVNGAATES